MPERTSFSSSGFDLSADRQDSEPGVFDVAESQDEVAPVSHIQLGDEESIVESSVNIDATAIAAFSLDLENQAYRGE